jgi:hypothetical protein
MSYGSTQTPANTLQDDLNVGAGISPPTQTHKFRQSFPAQAETLLTITGVIAFAAVHQRLRWRGDDTSFYGLGFDDGMMFVSRRQPPIFEAPAQKVGAREILPGSTVNVRYRVDGRVNWLDAIQIVQVAEEESPFMPVMDHA